MKHRNKLIAALAVTGIVASAGIATAASMHERFHETNGGHRQMGGGFERMLERYDTDHDGKLTQAEINAGREKQLKQYDKNADGKLDLAEYQALWSDQMRERMVKSFQRYDADGDGQVTLNEYQKRSQRLVERMD